MPKTDTKIDLKRVILPPGRLIVRKLEPEQFAEGSDTIFLPESARDKRCIAIVLKMGKAPVAGSLKDAGIHDDLVVGDEVIIGKYSLEESSGDEFGKDQGICTANETDVLAIVKPEKGKKK